MATTSRGDGIQCSCSLGGIVSHRTFSIGFCCERVGYSVMVVAISALLSGTHAIASTYSFHPCYHDNSIHVPIKQALEWLMTATCLSLDDMWFVSAFSMMDVL